MKKFATLTLLLLSWLLLVNFNTGQQFAFAPYEHLSDYGFFTGNIKMLQPAGDVMAYDLATPLFSDYAIKDRFIRIPAGTQAVYNDSNIFDLPEGTILIKNFSFPEDFRQPEKLRKNIETRLLILQNGAWQAYPYLWNEAQTDAVYDPLGGIQHIGYINYAGKAINTRYIIPNQTQCKGCHRQGDANMQPIGIAARHLNKDFPYAEGNENQLMHWQRAGIIRIPEDTIPANAVWNSAQFSIDQRARAYLDINCGFCHNPNGAANTSGLFLHAANTNSTALGVGKTPVAAGRGSGNLQYDIAPGHPEQSILIYRMKTTDPGIAMPEIGRLQMHKEGIALLSEWIAAMR